MSLNDALTIIEQHELVTNTGRISQKYKRVLREHPHIELAIVQATAFLEYDAPINVRIKCLISGIYEQPHCPTCGKPVQMAISGPRIYTFPTYCHSKCFSGLRSTQDARRKTNLDRYDATSYIGSQEGREHAASVMLEKYGVPNAFLSQEIKDKAEQTIQQKYGDRAGMQQAMNEARDQTVKRKYGSQELFTLYRMSRKKKGS